MAGFFSVALSNSYCSVKTFYIFLAVGFSVLACPRWNHRNPDLCLEFIILEYTISYKKCHFYLDNILANVGPFG